MLNKNAMQAYRTMATHSNIEEASPHKLIQMLMQGALEKIALAKSALTERKIGEKGENISKAISIIDTLKASLNKEKGGEIASNLDDLYEYMMARLLVGNLENNVKAFDEVTDLLVIIKSGWDEISEFGLAIYKDDKTETLKL